MPKMPPYMWVLFEKAQAERNLCKEWLIHIMRASPVRIRSKDDLRDGAMRDLKVSKSSFDHAWVVAIEELGYHDWYEPLRRSGGPIGGC